MVIHVGNDCTSSCSTTRAITTMMAPQMNGRIFVSYKCYYIPTNHQGLVFLLNWNYLFASVVLSFDKETISFYLLGMSV